MELVLYFDGAAEPNPGVGSWGVVITGLPPGPHKLRGALPGRATTNNAAEWTALERGLREVAEMVTGGGLLINTLTVRGDSQLVVNQLTGAWACRAANLLPFRDRCRALVADLVAATGCDWTAEWIPRAENAEADALSVAAWCEATGRPFPERRKAVPS